MKDFSQEYLNKKIIKQFKSTVQKLVLIIRLCISDGRSECKDVRTTPFFTTRNKNKNC